MYRKFQYKLLTTYNMWSVVYTKLCHGVMLSHIHDKSNTVFKRSRNIFHPLPNDICATHENLIMFIPFHLCNHFSGDIYCKYKKKQINISIVTCQLVVTFIRTIIHKAQYSCDTKNEVDF